MEITGKKISIIGAVRSGVAAARLAKKLGAIPFVSDSNTPDKLHDSITIFEKENIKYECEAHTDKVYDCEFIITSPGVPTNSPVLSKAIEKGIKIYSEVEFASWFCRGKIIAITGTNGKTTTTSLMAHMLNENGLKCYAAGNIGSPFSDIVLDVKENEFVALETSSFQLDFIEKFKPQFSIILNITPDHLDRYENNLDLYIASKIKITSNLDEDCFFIYNADDPLIFKSLTNKKMQKLSFSVKHDLKVGTYLKGTGMHFAWFGKDSQVCSSKDLFIKGKHNIANALAVLAIAKLIKIPNLKIREAFSSFKGVEHRIEFIRELGGVEYYNDSKATNVDSVIVALESFEKPIFLILGGKDKGNDYSVIDDLVKSRVKKVYAIGVSADKVYNHFYSIVATEKMNSLEACAQAARAEAPKGSVLLLSPACASFDMFDNYEHRGKVFKDAVNKLK